jgi:hypothetical protein
MVTLSWPLACQRKRSSASPDCRMPIAVMMLQMFLRGGVAALLLPSVGVKSLNCGMRSQRRAIVFRRRHNVYNLLRVLAILAVHF